MSQENVELVGRAYAAWNEPDLEAMLAILHPDFEYVTSGLFPGLAPVYRGHQGWTDYWLEFRRTWEKLRIEVNELRDLGDQVLTLFTFEGRGRAGLEAQRRFGNVWTIRDGLVLRLQGYESWEDTLEAVGLGE
jgi:ketosteroid isomerase-like protein